MTIVTPGTDLSQADFFVDRQEKIPISVKIRYKIDRIGKFRELKI
jgi:hypothetical protein